MKNPPCLRVSYGLTAKNPWRHVSQCNHREQPIPCAKITQLFVSSFAPWGTLHPTRSDPKSRTRTPPLANDCRRDEDHQFGAAFVVEHATEGIAKNGNIAEDRHLSFGFVMFVLNQPADDHGGP